MASTSTLSLTSLTSQKLPKVPAAVLYIEATNSLLLVGADGELTTLDSGLESSLERLFVLPEKTQLVYEPTHKAIVLIDEQHISFRRDCAGSYFLRSALTNPQDGMVHFEMTVAEATKLVSFFNNDVTVPEQLSPVIESIKSQLERARTTNLKWDTISVEGKLSDLRDQFVRLLLSVRSTDSSWLLPIIAAVLERIHLQLDHPYNFDLGNDGAGLDKAVMASESARKLTFDHWPHMHYRWALPGQMAEAGFYHQPNTTGDDRVMCFTCNVCLVCWEPADEPWSEHERHSPQCPFVRGDFTQNVPSSITMGSTKAVAHGLTEPVHCVSTVSQCDWLAVATLAGQLQLWRMDRVVQALQNFTVDLDDPYIGMKTGYMFEPRRPQRVTWSDDALEPHVLLAEATGEKHATSPGKRTLNEPRVAGAIPPQPDDLRVTALCCCNRPTKQAKAVEPGWEAPAVCSPALIVGIGLDDWRLRSPSGTWSRASSAEVDALNTMNAAPAPRIDGGVKRYRPFLIAYKIDENASRAETAERGAKNAPGSKGSKRRGANADGKAATSLSESLGIGESTQLVVPMVDDHELSMTGASDQDMDDELMLVPAEEEHWEDEAAVLESISQTVGGFGPPDLMMSGGFGSSASFGSGLATPPMGHAMMMTSVGGKSADALKPQSDLVQIQCEPPLAQLLVLQCFRLPASVDQPGIQVDKIVPACDGCSVVVVVNRVEDTSDPTVVTAALLVYRLSFSGLMTGLQEQPLREHLFKGHGAQIGACALLPAELLGRDALDAEVPDAFAFVNALGELRAVDLNDGRILYAGEKEHLVDVTLVADSKLCVVDKDGVMRLLQLTAPLMQMEDTFEAVLRGDASDRDASLLAHQPMTAASLRRMWELTRSEMTSSQSATTSGSSPGFAALVPSCWSEVQQHQRFRKNPQHYLRDERHTKSWHLQPDGVQSSKAHVFELSLLAGQRVSHLDVRFVFHPMCMGCPDIQVTLLRRRAKTERSPPSSGTFADLKAFAEVVAGPYRLGDWQDLAESGALVQIACSALQSDRQRHFYVHIEALSDESDSQKAWKARVEEEDRNNPTADGKSMTTSMTSVNRSAPMPMAHPTPVGFNADTKHPAFLFQSGIGRGFSVSAGRGTSAKLPASYGDDEAYSSKIPKLPPIAPKKPPDERKGCDWVEEVSITIWRCKKTSDAKEKLQRAAMLLSTELHEELVRVASAADASFAKTASQTLFYQHLAIDVLLWLLDHWSSASSLDLLLNVRQLVGGHFKTILTNSFFRAPRSIAHKWSAVFAELFRSLKVYDFDSYMELVGDLADSLSKELPGVYGVRSAGSLTWLFALVARLIRADPLGAGQPLLQACVHTLATVGRFWVKAQNATHAKLLTKYRLSGLPLELLMYDWPSPALGVWQRAAIHPPAQFGLVDGHPTAMPSTAYTASELSQDEMDWAEMLNVSVGDNQIATSSSMTASSYNPYSATAAINPFTGAVVPQMGIGRKQRQRYLLGREHLCGLLEVEPLTFSCQSASDNVRVENLETGLSVAIGGRPLCSGMGAGPIPLPDMAHGDDGMHQSNPALAHAVSSMNQQVQSILSKQMQLLALQQQRQKLQGQLNDQTGGMPAVDASITPATQGSSASTFGVPTTPKTTPFMTPTPLSPSQLSPINSETNLSTFTDGLSNDAKESTNALNTSSISLMPQDLLKPPPAQMLCVDRMNAGARKFVVLDFGVPIMLTDVLIPACAEIGSICIDVWLRGESVDGQRLLVSNEIDRKSVAITDLQPLMLCRYIKMTYIGRQGLNSCSCRIPLGSFFGHRFFSAWQLFACGAASSSSSLADDLTVATSPTTAATVSLRHLRQLSEDLRCRHQLAAAELRQLVKEDQDDATVRQVYRECSQLRLQWNIVRGVVERLEADGKSLQTTDSFLDYKSWSDCCFDQLRVVADVLMTSLVQATPYVAIAPPPTVSSAFRFLPPLVDLQSAVQHFHDYCTQGFPRLQVLCSTWLFQHGCTASWWGQFFPTILERFFSTPDKKGNDRLFLLVSYLCDQTVKCGNAQVIAELLVLVDRLLHDNAQRPLDTTLLTWTLLLLSSAYDVALGYKRRSDRWAFLAGENAASTSDSHSHGYISRASQIRRPIGSSSKQGKPPKPPAKWISDSSQLGWELMELEYQQTLQLADDVKHFFGKTIPYITGWPAKVKWRDSSSSSKAPSSAARKAERAARKRHRSRGIRLKLSHELCLSVASGLIRLLTVGGDQLPTPGKLVACKVIAKTCANASVTVIPLVAALGGDTEKLLKLGVDARQSPWMRHAVLCLLLDVTDAEHRAVLRAQTVVSSLQPPPPPPPPMVHVQMTSSSGTVPPSAAGETGAFGGSDKDKDKEKDKDSAGSTPGSSTVPTTSASSPTSTSSDTLTQTSDDATTSASGNPATAADAQAKIDAALLKIDPIDLPGSAVDKETRTKMLWALCKELIHTHLNNGEAFSNMDSWLASAKNTEKTLAAQSKNPELYKVRMQKYISMQSSGKYMNLLVGMSDMMQNSVVAMGGAGSASTSSGGYGAGTFNDWSPMSSSLGALPFPVDPFGMSDALPPPGGFYSWGHTSSMGSSNTTLPSSSPGAYAEAKEKLSKLCEHLQMSNNASATTPISSLSFLPSTASGGVPITGSGTDMGGLLVGLDETALTANVGGSNADDASASGAESANGGSPDPEGSLSGSVSGDYRQPTGAEALYAFHQLQIEVDARVQGEAVAVQPASTTSDERLEAQLGWRALTECRKWMLLGDTLTRLALKNLTPLGKIAKEKSSRSGGDEVLLLQSATGGSLETLMEAISGLIERIDDGAAADYVERLLSFYWDLLAGVGKQRKTIPTDVLPLKGLTHSAINALVNYATTANDLSEHLWTMVLKALESALRCSPPLTMTLIQSDKFTDLLMRFICQSGGKFNSSSSAGPAMVNTFGEFLQRLHTNAADNTTILCEKIVVTLTRIFSEGFSFGIGYAPYPVDVLLKVVETIRVWVLAYARLSESTVAELVAVVCRFLRAFMTGNSPVKQATAGVGVRPDLCFQTTVSAELASSLTATAAHSIEPTTGQASVIVEGSGLGNKGLIDRHEGLLCALLAEVVRLCNIPAAAAHVIATQPQAVNDLLAVLAVCACANDTLALDGLLTSDAEKYQPTSVADWALWTLLAIAKNVSVIDSDHLLELVVEFLSANSRETSTGAALSAPLVYAIVNIVDNHSKQETFSRLGGHVLVSKQLLACVEATTSDWSSATYSPILRQLASLSSQVAGAEPTSPKRPSDVKVDGMINFAPIAQIASSSPMAHHLNSLLPSTPPHRRARTATWTYHFYPAECWLDLTLTLPYQILLQEVQIRPHVPTLNTGPGAVQVELGSDPYATSLSVLGPPVATVGYSKIRISTAQYPYPVQTVRIHLKRPPDSSNLGLSQILLLGSSSSNALAASITLGSDFVHWLTILDRLSGSAPSVWSYAPTLPGALVSLFLTQPLTVDVYSRVAAVLTRFDARSVDDVTIVFLILQHIVAGRSVTEDVLPWLADLLLTFCSPSPTHSVELAGRRQKQLVEGVVRLLDVGRSSQIVAQQSAATVIVWSTACVLWTNQNDSTMRKSTAAAVGAVDTFVDILANVAKNYSQNEESLRDACSWALCSVGRLGDDRLDKLLKSIGINMNKKEGGMMAEFDKASLFNESNLSVIAKAAQSATVSGRLKTNGFLKALVDSVVKACTAQGNRCDDDVMSAVNCLAELAAVDLVADYLDTEGSLLFDALLRFIVANANALGNSAATRRPSLLESASINLFKRCLAYGGGHRERFSAIVSELLKESEGGLNSALQQIVLCTLLEDEQIDVVIEGASDGTAGSDNDFTNRIGHPAFGCSRRDKVTCVSLHSLCRELLPGATKRDSTAKKEKHVSYSADIDDHTGQQQSQAAKSWYEMPEGGMAGVGNEHVLINAVDQQILAAVQFGKKPKQPIDSSKLPRRRASDAYRFISHLMCAESSSTWLVPGEWSVGQLLTMVKTDSNDRRRDSDGFFALRLTVKACSLQELLKSVSEMKTKPPQSSPSTLQFFARHGGLAILAQHLQLYQPTGANMPSRMSNSTREGTSGSGMSAPPSAFTAYPTYGPTDIYDDFEFIDLPASTLAANQNVWGTYTVGQSLQKAGNRLNQAMGTAGLSPHVVVAFSVFLRLAGYAELLVTCDRQRSKRLLRLAMGVTSDHGRSSREGKQSSDGDALSLLSFVVLDQLYREKSASSAEGRAIRQASMDLGVIDILLVCLASFAHQTPRFPELRETGPVPEAVYLIEQLLRATNAAESNSSAMGGAQVATAPTSTANEERGPQFWAKGTGFGSGTTQQQWNVDLHVMKRKQDEDTVTCLLKVLASFIYPDSLSIKETSSTSTEDTSENDAEQSEAKLPPTFSTLLKRSCLVPTLSSYLRNDSVLDISRHVRVYESVMALVGALAMMDELTPLLSESESGQSLTTMLRRLHDCINIYLSKLTKEQLVHINENSSSATTPVEGLKGQDVTDDQSSSTEEGLLKLAPMIRHACALITEKAGLLADADGTVDGLGASLAGASEERRYIEILRLLQFDSIPFFGENGTTLTVPYHYESSLLGAKDTGVLAPRTRRLAQEVVTLSNSLPISSSSSVFVRTSEERLDVMKVLITGPADTPYQNGCFEFDVWFPTDYPNSPMHVNLQTTGNHTVRFNPNLYNDGKVCLSVLNTWHGRPEERWNAETSSFLQVIVSMQSLILVSEPYFNEPGYERSRGTAAGQQASKEYDANIRQATVRWAMLEQLRRPSPVFADVIARHFWLKRDEICKQIAGWIAETETLVEEQRGTARNMANHLTALKRHFQTLKEEFKKMTCPVGLEDSEVNKENQEEKKGSQAGEGTNPEGDSEGPSASTDTQQAPSSSQDATVAQLPAHFNVLKL